jgi:hypothetical protein
MCSGVAVAWLIMALGPASSWAAPTAATLLTPPFAGYTGTNSFVASRTPTFTWSRSNGSSGPITYAVLIDGQAAGTVDDADCSSTCSFTPTTPLTEEQHAWKVAATDGSGTAETDPKTFTVDVTPPKIVSFIVAQPDGVHAAGPAVSVIHGSVCPHPQVTTDVGGDSVLSGGASFTLDGRPLEPYMWGAYDCKLTEGLHTVTATVDDAAGNTTTASLVFRTDLVPPQVTYQGTTGVWGTTGTLRAVITPGTAVLPLRLFSFFASSALPVFSALPASALPPYALTVSGNDSDAEIAVPFTSTTPIKVFVSVTIFDAEGDRLLLSSQQVTLTSSPEPSIAKGRVLLAGGRYTRSSHVTLRLIAPPGARHVTVRNGATGVPQTFPVAQTIPWTVAGSGDGRSAATIHVSFDQHQPAKVYSVPVLLDSRRPVVSTATRSSGVVEVKSRDTGSGLAKIQVAALRTHPAKARTYRSRLRSSEAQWVRVIDRAGNRSPWHHISRSTT